MCDSGEVGKKLVQNSVTYFMNGLLVEMKLEIFGNFLHSISIALRRSCLAHPIK